MKTRLLIAATAAMVAGCGAPQTKQAQSACEPPPATVVTKDLVEGDGLTAIPLTSALVFYTGWVYDPCKPDHKGAEFDTNVGKRVPFGFRIGAGKVIKGWDEGLPGMKEGGKRLMIIPSAYGYGATEIPGKIPANSALVFEVDLVQLSGPGLPPPVNRKIPPK
jgi:FKBP-type peptidyl-prolyl cis-trans isomerase